MQDLLGSDSSGDFACFEDAIKAIITCDFHPTTIELFKLARLFAFVENQGMDVRPLAAGNVLCKFASKALASYRV